MAFKKDVVEIIEPRDIFVGNKKAAITLEEFGEYESETCAKANEIVIKILEEFKDQVRFSFRHFPLTNIHQKSLKASEAAVAAGQDGKFWEMHNVLFANRRNLGTTSLKLHSREAGINNKRFLDDLVNATYGWQVQGDIREGKDRGVTTIPAFFVNNHKIETNTYEEIKKVILDAIKNPAKYAGTKKVFVTKPLPEAPPSRSAKAAAAKAAKANDAKAKEAVVVKEVKAEKVVAKPTKLAKAVKVAAKAAPKVAAKPVKKVVAKAKRA
jgi:predicted DsbA family dithiol-disulfide isomerase